MRLLVRSRLHLTPKPKGTRVKLDNLDDACADIGQDIADKVFDELDSRTTDDAQADGDFQFTLTEVEPAGSRPAGRPELR